MRSFAIFASLLAAFLSYVSATALTYQVTGNEKACFFAQVNRQNAKIAFYFAVQSGGSFDIDYEVTNPASKIIMSGIKERQGDFVFTAQAPGEYKFCFSNEHSSYTDKMVDFEIAVEDEQKHAQLPTKGGSTPEQHLAIEDTVMKISSQLSSISRMQKYFRTRENRNFSTVRSTEHRIFKFSLIEVSMMCGMAALQVFIVKYFFQGARKGYV